MLDQQATDPSGYPSPSPPVLLFILVGVSVSLAGGGTWNTVLFRRPRPQVDELAPFRTERAPRVPFPWCGLAAQGTCHGSSVMSVPEEEKA